MGGMIKTPLILYSRQCYFEYKGSVSWYLTVTQTQLGDKPLGNQAQSRKNMINTYMKAETRVSITVPFLFSIVVLLFPLMLKRVVANEAHEKW
jgi:hypothetical protein